MINSITYSVVFPISAVSLEGKFQPQPGVTAVVGPNGVGKTFTSIELARYLLYGKAALRGAASDYKKLDATGVFTIRGSEYTIKRSAKKEELRDAAGVVQAVGADAVTKKVVDLMGYGLQVFDICNASVQKKADLFGSMKPAERKRMIDQVVGLTSNEAVEKACRTEAATLKREAEAMTRQLVEPQKPEKPAGYRTSSDIGLEYAREEDLFKKARALTDQMRAEGEAPPRPRKPRPSMETIRALELAQREHEDTERRRKRLMEQTANAVFANYTVEQLEAAAERLTIRSLLENEVQCPHCQHEFVPGHGHVELPEGPDLSRAEIKRQMQLLADLEENNKAVEELQNLPVTMDVSPEFNALRDLDAEWEVYERQNAAVEKQRAINHQVMRDLKALGEVPTQEDLNYLKDLYYQSQYYEKLEADYEAARDRFESLSAEIGELVRLAGEFRKGGEALADARATLKAHLAPTLSRVASSLLNDMTHGKLHDVQVDEDMEISVNGQALETLSGGGETVANLALRLALGQVLVAQTFPVFLGDEMDADADDARREAVAEALKALIDNDHLKQIVLITHRSVDIADHVIDLGNTG